MIGSPVAVLRGGSRCRQNKDYEPGAPELVCRFCHVASLCLGCHLTVSLRLPL